MIWKFVLVGPLCVGVAYILPSRGIDTPTVDNRLPPTDGTMAKKRPVMGPRYKADHRGSVVAIGKDSITIQAPGGPPRRFAVNDAVAGRVPKELVVGATTYT